ncbi:MAG: PAS domain S-box protein [Prolixibacteraceae bacterium]|nr:PAS domain S-box protein [Prolixibacteraceae bacterium]MBT6765311.1 PAS domain S-box protein [Prolixibacteraceae bacterium]MBT6997017.1 PAS domain S-box protein [Prolixibacteraceae bacterium]MBT7396703.1 PAS domain S-box protein [Prolixibacteraceae bacterium]
MNFNEKRDKRFSSLGTLIIGFLSLTVMVVLLYLGYSSQTMANRQSPQIRVFKQLKVEMISSHLVLEEVLKGHPDENIQTVFEHFEKADNYVRPLLDGGQLGSVKIFPVKDSLVRAKLTNLLLIKDTLFELSNILYAEFDGTTGLSPSDQVYDVVFKRFIQKSNDAEITLVRLQEKNIQTYYITQIGLIVGVLTLGIFMLLVFIWLRHFKNNKQKQLLLLNTNLAKSEKRFRFMTENAKDMIYRMSLPDGKYEYVSPASLAVFGYTPNEFYDTPILIQKAIHPDWHKYFEEQWGKLIAGEMPPFYEYQIIHKSGETRWLHQRNTLVKDKKNKAIAIEGIVTDISKRKTAEKELLAEKEFSEKIIETSNAMIVGLDKDHVIRIFNNGAEKITGYFKEEVLGKDWFTIFFSDEIQDEMNAVWKEAWGVLSHSYENIILNKKGDKRIISWQTTGIYDGKDSNKHLMISIGEDITTNKQKEALVQESLVKLNEAQNIAHTGNWELDLITQKLLWSNEVYRIFDLEPQQFEATEEAFLNNIHPDDRKFVYNAFTESVKNKTPYNIVHRLLLKDGTVKYVNEVCKTYYNKSGEPIRSVGTVQDITERKQTEDALQESQTFNQTLLDTSPDLIYVYDIIERKNIYSNQGIQKILGYSIEEIQKMGENILSDLMHPDDFNKYLKEIIPLYQTTKDGEIIDHEYRMKYKNGNWCWLNSKESVFVRQDDGSPKQIFGICADVTKRKNVEESLNHSHNLMSYVIEYNKSDVAIHDRDLKYMYVSQSYLEHYQVKEKNVIGKHHYEVFPDLPQKWRDVHQKVLAGEILSADEDPYEREDGTVEWTRWECRPWHEADGTVGGMIVYTEIITERKEIEIALRNSEEYLTRLMQTIADPIFTVKMPEREIEYMNEAVGKLFGYKPDEVIGNSTKMFYQDEANYAAFGKVLKNALENNKSKVQAEQQLVTKNGKLIWTEIITTFLFSNGLLIKVISVVRDITERKKTEEELEKHHASLEELVDERTAALEESHEALLNIVDDINQQSAKLEKSNKQYAVINQELETFTYSVSHDLKAPLRGIDGYSQLLYETYFNDLNEEAKTFLKNIRKSSQQMNVLIEDLLAYSRMERQDYRFERIPFKALVDNLLLYYSNIISQNKVAVKLNISEAFMPLGDKDGLNLALRNLLDNAIKFTTHKKKAQIEIGTSENETQWLIFVKDNGIGFDMKYHDRIFNIFQRLHLPEEYEGTGIGLAMVHKAMNRMNGKIWAESEPGKGTCFYIEIGK